jgi:tetratricopeptide (TPR) repeat protein
MKLSKMRFIVTLLAALAALSARAAPPDRSETDAMSRARTHFEAGKAHYQLGHYDDAIRELSAGYALVPRPDFLLDLGQVYRATGELERARELYDKYLRVAPPVDPQRPNVTALIGEIDRLLEAKRQHRSVDPPTLASTSATGSRLSASPTEPSARTAPQTPEVTAAKGPEIDAARPAPAPRPRSRLARYWWIIPTTALVLGGVAVGIYFGVRPTTPDCHAASVACINAQ